MSLLVLFQPESGGDDLCQLQGRRLLVLPSLGLEWPHCRRPRLPLVTAVFTNIFFLRKKCLQFTCSCTTLRLHIHLHCEYQLVFVEKNVRGHHYSPISSVDVQLVYTRHILQEDVSVTIVCSLSMLGSRSSWVRLSRWRSEALCCGEPERQKYCGRFSNELWSSSHWGCWYQTTVQKVGDESFWKHVCVSAVSWVSLSRYFDFWDIISKVGIMLLW